MAISISSDASCRRRSASRAIFASLPLACGYGGARLCELGEKHARVKTGTKAVDELHPRV